MATGPVKYVKEVVKEGKRVRWPKRDELIPAIIAVVCITAFVAIVLSLEDFVAASLIQQMKVAFGKGAEVAAEAATSVIEGAGL